MKTRVMTAKITKDILYVKMTLFEAQRALRNQSYIGGVLYKEDGSRHRSSIYSLPHNTTIRFWKKHTKNISHLTIASGLWDKKQRKINNY
jgi:hypothetical protein